MKPPMVGAPTTASVQSKNSTTANVINIALTPPRLGLRFFPETSLRENAQPYRVERALAFGAVQKTSGVRRLLARSGDGDARPWRGGAHLPRQPGGAGGRGLFRVVLPL